IYKTGQGVQHHQQQQGGFEAPLVHKQFFTISAPEDHDSLDRSKHFVIGRPQKNYRVVFIKAPSSSSANVKLSAEYAPKEEKTVIYVLSKKDSALEVNDIATPAPTVPSKPEVFFIKYKTEDEATHAQKQIQAEYDKIEGTSEHADGGVGQVQSVIGSLGGGSDFGASSTNVHQTSGSIGGFSGVGSSGVGTGGFSGIGSSGVGTGGFSGIGSSGVGTGGFSGISTSSIGTGGFSGIGSSISSGSGSAQGNTYLPPSN
ncbi:keratin, type I cytoskeletal 10-like, partial [Teleopsis dalmanni]|uniref:keratin, type I cytoskeletal 10-like n=1 Tax=Teleopsis dalmanni TaxID=139649 RepID=UPI0018CDA673